MNPFLLDDKQKEEFKGRENSLEVMKAHVASSALSYKTIIRLHQLLEERAILASRILLNPKGEVRQLLMDIAHYDKLIKELLCV